MGEQNTENYENQLQESRRYWNDLASSFDDEPDHGLRDPLIRETWTKFIKAWLPPFNSTILDIGCGTGSLSVILAELGHKVTGIDLSPSMITLAKEKAAVQGCQIDFHVMDAAFPNFSRQEFDLIVCRHLLWALPEPNHVLQRWAEFLKQNGRLFLVEGFWNTGAGLHAKEISEMLPPSFTKVSIQNLSGNPNFWGGEVSDERYAIIADLILE
ncbi:MAG: class I SAM-dependent methyltransferase [Chloroflexi bacterium]|nr:class I SAM-dependent methyltransferase [Chloroflexota bacterium]